MEKKFVSFLGRLLLAQIFIVAGVEKILDPAGTQAYMASRGMPMTGFFLVVAIIFELGGGLSLLSGFRARWGAFALVVFLIPTTLIFHTNFSEPVQQVMLMKNLAIMGGLLMITAFGPGQLSIDAYVAATKKSPVATEKEAKGA